MPLQGTSSEGGSVENLDYVLLGTEGLGDEHKATIRLIRMYKEDFEDFGILPFEMAKPNAESGRPEK